VPKILTIGSVGSSPHIGEIYGYEVLNFFFILRQAYRPNKNTNLDHIASIDADSLKEVPFGALNICEKIFRGHICPQKLKKISHHCTSMKILNNF
jgi:hypothetical protein